MKRMRWSRVALLLALSPVGAPGAAGPGPAKAEPRIALPVDSGADFGASDPQLAGLIELLLEANPRVLSAWARARSSRELAPQARTLPDPQIQYRYFARTPETRVGPQQHALEISQGIPWRGKRGLQGKRAEHLAASLAWNATDLERGLVAELKRTYFEVAYLQEALTVNDEERELLRRFENIALKRYATGQGIQQSVVKVQTEVSRLGDRKTDLHRRLDAMLRRVAELIGRSEQELVLERIVLDLPELDLDADHLERISMEQHPKVEAAEARIRADRSWSKRRALEEKPDFRVGVGYTRVGQRDDTAGLFNPPEDNGKDILALTVGVNIPIHRKRIRAGVAEAAESLRSDEQALQATRDRLRYDIQEAALRLDSLGERTRLYRDVIIPQAEESLASAEAAYATNKQDFLDLLDAERVLFDARLTVHRLQSDYWIALADLEFAAGVAIPGESGKVAAADRSGNRPGKGQKS